MLPTTKAPRPRHSFYRPLNFDISGLMGEGMGEAKTVAIIGAGPVGLAAAAHVVERGLQPIVLEAGGSAGHAVRQWGHVQMFSPWEYNIDRAAARLLEQTGGILQSPSNIRPAPNC